VVGSHSRTDLLQDARQDVGFGGQEDQGALLQHLKVAVRGPAARLLLTAREGVSQPGTPHPQHPPTPHAGTKPGDPLQSQSHRGSPWISPRPGKDEAKPSAGVKGCPEIVARGTPTCHPPSRVACHPPTSPLTRQAARFLSEGALARMLLAGTFPWGRRGSR